MRIDFRILEMLASKICHDIISPVGAINNGVELIEDIGGSVAADAMKLISASASQAARRLRLFRMAYGRAGAEGGVRLRDMRLAASEYLAAGKSKLEWGEEQAFTEIANKVGGLKVLLNMVMLAEEVLSHGGVIRVETIAQVENYGAVVMGIGSPALMSEQLRHALEGHVGVEEVSPRTVHAYVTGRMAEAYGFKLSIQQLSDEKINMMLMPAAEVTAEPAA